MGPECYGNQPVETQFQEWASYRWLCVSVIRRESIQRVAYIKLRAPWWINAFLCVFLCEYVCVGVGVCVHVYMWVHVCGGQRLTLDVLPQASSSLFSEIGSLIGLEFIYKASLAGSEPQRYTFPALGLQVSITIPDFFIWVLEDWAQIFMLVQKAPYQINYTYTSYP